MQFQPQAHRPQIVQTPDGRRFAQQGTQLREVKRKPKPLPQPIILPDGTIQAPLPEIPPDQIAQVVGLLERAHAGNQDPEVVCASRVRVHVPEASDGDPPGSRR